MAIHVMELVLMALLMDGFVEGTGNNIYEKAKKLDSSEEILSTEDVINRRNGFKHDEMVVVNPAGRRKRRGVLPDFVRWPKVNGELIIPYAFDDSIPKKSQKRKRIEYFIGLMNSFIKCNENVWRPKTNETHYVLFKNSTGCSSFLGLIEDHSLQPQALNLTDDCVFENEGSVLHEMLHAMGFVHEHQRIDRDKFVKINSENIIPTEEAMFNFLLFNTPSGKSPYQIGSVLHYGPFDFALDKSIPVITRLDPNNKEIMGQRLGMTDIDKDQVNAFYECSPLSITKLPPVPPTTTLQPPMDNTLKFCNWKNNRSCMPNIGFNITKEDNENAPEGRFLSATTRRIKSCSWCPYGYFRWRYQCQTFEERSNRITIQASQRQVEEKSQCRCHRRYGYRYKHNCDSTKFCLYASVRRRYDPTEKAHKKPSTMTVCLRNCKPWANCYLYYQSIGCKKLTDDPQVRNQWKEAYFEFNGNCKGVRNSIFVEKGIDRFEIRQLSLTAGACPLNNEKANQIRAIQQH